MTRLQRKHRAPSKYMTPPWWPQLTTKFRGIRAELKRCTKLYRLVIYCWSRILFHTKLSGFFFFDPLLHVSVDLTLPKTTIPLDKSKAILDFFSGVHQFCAIKTFTGSTCFQWIACFLNRKFMRKQNENCVILCIPFFTLPQEKMMFSHMEQTFMIKQLLLHTSIYF